ncbi:MAG: metallophosphoesterase [Gemmatimonadaceae bacterium]
MTFKPPRLRSIRWSAGIVALVSLSSLMACNKRPPLEHLVPSDIETTVFLIGDAGEQDPRNPSVVLDSLFAQASVAPDRSVIVYLGDNVYPDGIPEEGRAQYADARRRLSAEVNAVPRGARGIFVPGNHDWAGETAFGLYSIRLQGRMITNLAKGNNVQMLPENGCPGPVVVDAGRLRLIALDTQWWLHDFIVRDSLSNCINTIGEVTGALRQDVEQVADGRIVVVAGHHPLMTGGQHGGYCGLSGFFRRLSSLSQDILGGQNRTMRDSLASAFKKKKPLVYASGHDHNLQLMRGPEAQYLLVSGAGSSDKTECAVYLRESYYTSQHRAGFMRLDIMKGKGALLTSFEFLGSGARGYPFSRWLELR